MCISFAHRSPIKALNASITHWSLRAPSSGNRVRRVVVMLHELQQYTPPPWAKPIADKAPSQIFKLGLLPTPVHRWHVEGIPDNVELWIKRDDLSGMQLSGNKVRKLEFLIAEALRSGHDSVVTLGGIQSNHARATAVSARYAGLDAHLVLRNRASEVDADPGLVGNLLVERLVGAHIYQVTKEEYGRFGQGELGRLLLEKLQSEGKKPYLIPVGGSSGVGSWGYLQAWQEILAQSQEQPFTDVVMACGSGGTTAGLALGNYFSGSQARLHAFAVCDTPEYFYDYMDGLFEEMGAGKEVIGAGSRQMVHVIQARGAGYAISRDEELADTLSAAMSSGVILDPVYSGKAFHGFKKEVQKDPSLWQGRRVLFIHTGGLLGMYDKVDQLQPLLTPLGRASRMTLPTDV